MVWGMLLLLALKIILHNKIPIFPVAQLDPHRIISMGSYISAPSLVKSCEFHIYISPVSPPKNQDKQHSLPSILIVSMSIASFMAPVQLVEQQRDSHD